MVINFNCRGLSKTFEISIQSNGKATQKNYTKKDLNEPDNYNGVISHQGSDILECDVKWASGSTAVNKASGWDGIPGELFKTQKDDAIKDLQSICQQNWKTQNFGKDQSSSQSPKKGSINECSNHQTVHSSPFLVRSCLKSYILGFSITQTKNFQTSKLGLERTDESEIILPTFTRSQRKQGNSRKKKSLSHWLH